MLADKTAIEAAYQEINIALYPLKQNLPCFKQALISEKRLLWIAWMIHVLLRKNSLIHLISLKMHESPEIKFMRPRFLTELTKVKQDEKGA